MMKFCNSSCGDVGGDMLVVNKDGDGVVLGAGVMFVGLYGPFQELCIFRLLGVLV